MQISLLSFFLFFILSSLEMIATLKFIQCKTIKRYGLGTLVDALYILYVDQPTANNLIIYIIHHYCCYCCVVHELKFIGLFMDRLVQG